MVYFLAIHRFPDYTAVLLALCILLAAGAGEYEEAARIAERLVKRRPRDYMTIGNLASVYRRLERLDEAERLVNQALALAPDSAARKRSSGRH